MKVNVAATPDPSVTPVLANPGSQAVCSARRYPCSCPRRDPNGDVLGYGASGLPPGLSIDGTTGLISGTPTATGSYNVVVAASDGVNSDVGTSCGPIARAEALTLDPMPSPAPQLAAP